MWVRINGIRILRPPLNLEQDLSEQYGVSMRSVVASIIFSLSIIATQTAAHPHVWVTGAASLHFEDTKITRVGMRWQFDAFFSQVLGADFDTNGDGSFDNTETKAMKDQVFTSLKDFGYFTHLRAEKTDGERQFKSVENFSVGKDSGELIFLFDLVLAEPIDAVSENVGLSVFDPTIYVDLILDGDQPVTLSGADNLGCTIEYRQGDEFTNESAFFVPQEAWLSCAGTG